MCLLTIQVHPDCNCFFSEQDIKYCAQANVPGHIIVRNNEEIQDPCDRHTYLGTESFMDMFCRRAGDKWELEEGTEASAPSGKAELDYESGRRRVELHGAPYHRTDSQLSYVSEESFSVDSEARSMHQLPRNETWLRRGYSVTPLPIERHAENNEVDRPEIDNTHTSGNGGLRKYFGGISRWFSKEG